LVALTTFLGTLLLGPERGIVAGVAAAALRHFWKRRRMPVRERPWRPAAAHDPASGIH
jgi:hypothetical protein